MGRRRTRRRPHRRPTKPKHNWSNKLTRESRSREWLLDKGQENYFKYDMEDLLRNVEVDDDKAAPLIATTFSKGSRLGIEDAQEFVKSKQQEGVIDVPTVDKILRLIERYTIYR